MKKNKFIFLIIVTSLLVLPQVSQAQAPDAIKYQAVARDASGEVLTNQQVEITIAILQGDVNGSEVFSETHTMTTNAYGLLTLNIGSVNSMDFATIQWVNGPYFVQVSLDGNIMGVSQLLSVPYAKYADEAGNTFSGSFNDLADVPTNIDLDATDDFSGDYTDLINTPAIPTDIADLSDNSSLLFDSDYNSLTNLPTLFSGNYSDLTGKPVIADSVAMYGFSGSFDDLADVPANIDMDATDDFSGDYTDLINTPAIPADLADLSDNSSLLFDGDYNSLTNLPTLFSGNYSDLTGKPVIADSVAMYGFSGSFNDLADVPANIDLDATDDFDGDYNSLINQPDLSVYTTTDTTLTEAEVDAMTSNNGYAMQTGLNDTASNIRGDLAAVAISGDYSDLSNSPDLSDTTNYADQSALEDSASQIRSDIPDIKIYSVGDFAHGGIVFWVDETGQHGLVCAKFDQSTGVRWYAGTNGVTRATGDGPYAGELNTLLIISAQVAIGDDGSDYAAQISNDLMISEAGKSYGDWYLPSKEELDLMFQNKGVINSVAITEGGVNLTGTYWSSTEVNSSQVYVQRFFDGIQNIGNKNYYAYKVRAIRAF